MDCCSQAVSGAEGQSLQLGLPIHTAGTAFACTAWWNAMQGYPALIEGHSYSLECSFLLKPHENLDLELATGRRRGGGRQHPTEGKH